MILCVGATRLGAQTVTLAWDPNSEPDVIGYIIGYGTAPGTDHQALDVGMSTAWTLSGLASGVTYYFRVYAYNATGSRSAPSNEVWTTVAGSGGCMTPDPFVALGGGTCLNGGWLPPSSTPVGGDTSVSQPVQPVAPTGTCSTPDPFAAMGGGTCYNGGWLPPGMPVPSGGTTTAPPPPQTQPPASAVTCSTPDPFVAMGGGTCYNGGWLPPGMPVPAGGSTQPVSAPPPTPAGTCTTPDPFVAIPGLIGLCVNGGWVPVPIQ